jgi:Ca-activated chloride channel family protein
MIERLRAASARGQKLSVAEIKSAPAGPAVPTDVRITIGDGQHVPADGAVLFDSASGDEGQFTFLSVAFADKTITANVLDPELTLLLFVGDLTAPRARVKLIDIIKLGGRRPLNLRRGGSEPVRLTLEDPSGARKTGVPAMEIVLGWKG